MYLLVAYKPDSADYCKGCLMASYSSDFVRYNNLSREDLVKRWGELLAKNMNLEFGEAGYIFHIFEDGVEMWGEAGACCDNIDMQDAEKYNSAIYRFGTIELEADSHARQLLLQSLNKKKMEEEIKAAENFSKARAQRREQYENLKKEFEP